MNAKLGQKTSKIKVNKNKNIESEKESHKSCKRILTKSYLNLNKENKDNKNGDVNNTNINININNNSNNINNFQYNIYNSPKSKINNVNKKDSKSIFPKIKSKKRVYLLHDLYYKFGNKNINKRNSNLLNEEKTNIDIENDGLRSARNKSVKFNLNNCRTEDIKQDSPKNISSRSLAEKADLAKFMKICNLKMKSKQNINENIFTNSIIRKNNSYNERLFNEYRRILNKEFIKYLNRFKCLYLKRCLSEFFQNIKLYNKKSKYLIKEFHKRNNSANGDNYSNTFNIIGYMKPRVANTNDQILKKIDSYKKKYTTQRNYPEYSTQKYFYTGDFLDKSDKNNYNKIMASSNNELSLRTIPKLNENKNENKFEKIEEDSNDYEEKLSIIISSQDDEILNSNNIKNNSNKKYKMIVKQNKNNDYFHNLNNKNNDALLNENIKKNPTYNKRKQPKVYVKKNNMINNIQKSKHQSTIINCNNSLNIDYNSTLKGIKNSRNEDSQFYISNNRRNFFSNSRESINYNDNEGSNNTFENEFYRKRKISKKSLINYHVFVNSRLKNFLKSKVKKSYNSFDDGINENNSLNNVSNLDQKELNIRFNTIPFNPKRNKYSKRKYHYFKPEHKDNILISSLKEKEKQIKLYHKKNKSNYINYNPNKIDFIYIKEEESSCTAKTSNNNISSLINQSSLNNHIIKNKYKRNTYERKIKDLNNIIKNNNDNKYLISCLNFFIKTLKKIKNNTLEEYFYKLHYYAAGNSLTAKLEDIKRKIYASLLKRKNQKYQIVNKEDDKNNNENKIKNKKDNVYDDVDNEEVNYRKRLKKKKQNEKLTNGKNKKTMNNSKNKKGSNAIEK